MVVFDIDLKNKNLDPIPVRRGCRRGPCACSGKCKKIFGYIDRKTYEDFVEKYVTLEDFVAENVILTKQVKEKSVPSYWISFNAENGVSNKYFVIHKLKEMFADQGKVMPMTLFGRVIAPDSKEDHDFINENKEILKKIIEGHGGKFEEYPKELY